MEVSEISFTEKERNLLSSYLQSPQFDIDYPDNEERMKVLMRVMDAPTMGKMPIKFSVNLKRFEESYTNECNGSD